MHEHLTYRETKERRSDYDELLARLDSVVEGDRNQLSDGAIYTIERLRQTMAVVSARADSYEERAYRHLLEAQEAMAEKVELYMRETVEDMNRFIEAYPDRFYVSADDRAELLPLSNLAVVGAGEAASIGMTHDQNVLVFADGSYHLLVDSRIVEA